MADAWGGSWGNPSAWGVSWGSGAAPVATRTNWDTSDPQFYDWWRKRAQEERQKLEIVQEAVEAQAEPPLREETIEAIEAASSMDEIVNLDLFEHERATLRRMIRDYQDMLDEEEALLLALIH